MVKTLQLNKRKILKGQCEMNRLSAEYECLTLEEFFEFLKELVDEFSDDSQKIYNLGFENFIMCSALDKAYEIIKEIEGAEKQSDWSKREKLKTVSEIEQQAQEDYAEWQREISGCDYDEDGNVIL